MNTKSCPRCREVLPVEAFSKNRRNRDGLQSYCRSCMAAAVRAYRDTERGATAKRNARRQWEQTEQGKASRREYLSRPEVKAAMRDRKRAADARYRKTDKWKVTQTAAKARRRDKMAAVRTTLTEAEWVAIVKANKGRCYYCKRRLPLEVDHVIPVSLGGDHAAENVVPACRSCNASKGNRILTLL